MVIRFNPKWIKLSCLGFIIMTSHHVYAQTESNQVAPTGQEQQYKQQGVEQNLQSLLDEHGRLLNEAILAAVRNAPQDTIKSGKARLLQNSRKIANVLASIYGPQAGTTFENLFNQHILLGSQYINAVKTNNQSLANQVSNQAIANGRMIAQFFSKLSPSIPYATWQNMFDEHVMIEAQQTKAYFQGDFNTGNQLRDESLVQLKEVASLIASTLQGQSMPRNNAQMTH